MIWFLVGIAIIAMLFCGYSLMKVSSKCSRIEEASEFKALWAKQQAAKDSSEVDEVNKDS